jgi:hypothetical protein
MNSRLIHDGFAIVLHKLLGSVGRNEILIFEVRYFSERQATSPAVLPSIFLIFLPGLLMRILNHHRFRTLDFQETKIRNLLSIK